ncbi:MAG: paraquat-inducible protein A [Methylococcales bacterium]|jgi:paraquat-inducible protein A|nr:paraquat-inducible protein A [Methylococcales bacterium]
MSEHLTSCHCCGKVQQLPAIPKGLKPVCCRCGTHLSYCHKNHNHVSGLLALSALILYIPAISIPLIHIEKLGYMKEDSLLTSVFSLLSEGYWLLGGVVLLFSIILPFIKLLSLVALSYYCGWKHYAKAFAYRWVEWVGRWGMLDILLMALLVAYIKLGDLVRIDAGLGLTAFTLMVLLSLLASALFNPQCLWEQEDD